MGDGHTNIGNIEGTASARPPIVETLLVRYGAGAHLISVITRRKHWNQIAWVLIVLGVVGWIAGLWICYPYAE